MPYNHRPNTGGRSETLTNTSSIPASGARYVETTVVMSNETYSTVVDQRSGAETGTADSEMSIADVVDDDRDSDARGTNHHMQRGSGESAETGLDGVAPFIERNPDNVASTLEWRARVLHAQDGSQVTSSRQRHTTAEERRRASLELKIERIRRRYHEQERILEREIVRHEQRYEWAMKQLVEEEKDEEDYPVADWWEVQSDYQPTECGGNDGNR